MLNEDKEQICEYVAEILDNTYLCENHTEILIYLKANKEDINFFSEKTKSFRYTKQREEQESKMIKEVFHYLASQSQTSPSVVLLNMLRNKINILDEAGIIGLENEETKNKIVEFIFHYLRMLNTLTIEYIEVNEKFALDQNEYENSIILFNEITNYLENFEGIFLPEQKDLLFEKLELTKENFISICEKCKSHKYYINEKNKELLVENYKRDASFRSVIEGIDEFTTVFMSFMTTVDKIVNNGSSPENKQLEILCCYVFHMPLLFELSEKEIKQKQK